MVWNERIEELFLRHRDRVAECLGLWWSLGLVQSFGLADQVPGKLKAISLVSAVLLGSSKWDYSGPFGRQFLRRLPVYCGIAALVSVIAFFLFDPPGLFYSFGPLWIALVAAWYFGMEVYATALANLGRTGESAQKPRTGAAQAALRAAAFVGVRNARHRFDVFLGDACILATFAVLGWHFLPGQWPAATGFVIPIGACLAASVVLGSPMPSSALATFVRAALCLAVLGGAGWAWFSGCGHTLGRGPAVVFLYAALVILAYRMGLRVAKEKSMGPVSENFRWILLGLVWVLLFHPFFQAARHGAGDAGWYSTMLADMVAQTRAGVFPVFAGQSEYEFNGAIYPLRVAPAFHYFGALLDTLTFRALGIFSLQNLLLVLVGFWAIVASYLTLARLTPRNRWAGLGLTVVFMSCPGVLGIVFNSDLYMSWMTLPFVPLVCYGIVRSFERDDLKAMMLIGGPLGLMWWGHSPIALWMTLVAATSQVVRLFVRRPNWQTIARAGTGGAMFGLIAAYPLLSVLKFPVQPGVKMSGFQVANADLVAHFLSDVFPAVLLPVSPTGRLLSDFQLGYALWLLVALCIWKFGILRAAEFRTLLLISAGLILLLTPIPGLNLMLWRIVPAIVRDTTSNWAMNRLYLVLASLLVFAGALAISKVIEAGKPRRATIYVLLALGCVWSLSEAIKFGQIDPGLFSRARVSSELKTENIMLTSFAYLVFPRLPGYFSHGVTDPELENRLLSRASRLVEQTNAEAIVAAIGHDPSVIPQMTNEFVPAPPGEERSLVSERPIVLSPGKRYLAEFTFDEPAKVSGILEIRGRDFFRKYALPEYGEPKSFGVGGEHSRFLALWCTGETSETLDFRLRRDPPPAEATELMPFGSFRLLEYDPEILPIRMESWIPYRARVRSDDEAWLETPRVFQAAYRATVNGLPAAVGESPDGLTMVAVPAGTSHVEVVLDTPVMLRKVFWTSCVSAVLLFGLGAYCAALSCRSTAM